MAKQTAPGFLAPPPSLRAWYRPAKAMAVRKGVSPAAQSPIASGRSEAARVSGQSGFTLIEVLVALTILSISISVLLAIFLQGLDRARESASEASARVLAQALVNQAKAAPNLKLGITTGTVNGFVWRTAILPFGTAADRTAWHTSPAQIVATISWRGDGGERSISLSALRLLPKPGGYTDDDDDN